MRCSARQSRQLLAGLQPSIDSPIPGRRRVTPETPPSGGRGREERPARDAIGSKRGRETHPPSRQHLLVRRHTPPVNGLGGPHGENTDDSVGPRRTAPIRITPRAGGQLRPEMRSPGTARPAVKPRPGARHRCPRPPGPFRAKCLCRVVEHLNQRLFGVVAALGQRARRSIFARSRTHAVPEFSSSARREIDGANVSIESNSVGATPGSSRPLSPGART
jgi:hypothetical protein